MLLASTAAPALQAAGLIGTWNTDVSAGRSVLDLGAASVLAGNPGLVGKPVPLDVALGRIHPEDRDRVFDTIQHLRQTGGSVAIAFRILTGAGGASPRSGVPGPAETLDAAADHCIQAHTALERHGDASLHLLSRMLLLGVGRALAQRAS